MVKEHISFVVVWCAQVAQSVEQGTENPRVSSSILFLGTTIIKAFGFLKTGGLFGYVLII